MSDKKRKIDEKDGSNTTSDESTGNSHELNKLIEDDDRIGWPDSMPKIEPKNHGWFRQGNFEVLQYLLKNNNVNVIIELGSWLGSSTKFLLNQCPEAIVFAVDIWSNEVYLILFKIKSLIIMLSIVFFNRFSLR